MFMLNKISESESESMTARFSIPCCVWLSCHYYLTLINNLYA